jgi:hypothetical protein
MYPTKCFWLFAGLAMKQMNEKGNMGKGLPGK